MSTKKIWRLPIALVVVLITALVFGGITVSADTVQSGECCEGISWSLDSDGTLTISGTGATPEYGYSNTPWYPYTSDIKAVVISDGITNISSNAFYNCSNLETVSVGSDVESIGFYAFINCTSLKSISLPSCFNSFKDGACFKDCTNLTSVTIGSGSELASIPDGTFSGCSGLTTVTLPDSIKYIGKYAFDGCNSLTISALPKNVKEIDSFAFQYCTSITSLDLGDKLTDVGYGAFQYCSNLASVQFPDTLYGISSYAFNEAGLTTLNLPSGVRYFGDNAFSHCDNLTSLDLTFTKDKENGNMVWFDRGIFENCKNLTTVKLSGDIPRVNYGMFFGCENLTTVTIPDDVPEIYWYAFDGCYSLSSINIPSKLESFGDHAFEGCKNLTSITIPETVTSIGSKAFSETGITSIVIPSSVEYLGSEAFSGCENLTTVTINPGITEIRSYTFYDCKSLTSITIPDTVTSIGYDAFCNIGPAAITIPDSVTNLGDHAFAASNITSVIIPGSIKQIEESAFSGCSKLSSVTIEDGVETIGSFAFAYCDVLKTITIPGSVRLIDNGAFYNSGLVSISIPGSVKDIKYYAFQDCHGLKFLELQEGCSTLYHEAFKNCTSLETIILPSTINYITDDVFDGCSIVKEIYCYAEPGFNWDDNGFCFITEPHGTTVCYVPEEYVADYRTEYSYVNVVFKAQSSTNSYVRGHSITLSSDIAVNFYVKLPEEYTSKNTVAYLSWGEDGYNNMIQGKLVPIDQYGSNYKITCGVAARSMSDTISLVIYDSNGTCLLEDSYSVIEYVNVLAKSYPYDDNLRHLLASMVHYGSCAQDYFNYRLDHDVLEFVTEDLDCVWEIRQYCNYLDTFSGIYSDNLTIRNIADDSELGLKYYGASLQCTSKMKMRFYFEVTDVGKFNAIKGTAFYKSKNLKFVDKVVDGKKLVYIETPGLKPGELADIFEINIGGKYYTYDYMYYINRVSMVASDFRDTALAAYAFSHFAREYQEGLTT